MYMLSPPSVGGCLQLSSFTLSLFPLLSLRDRGDSICRCWCQSLLDPLPERSLSEP